MQYVCILHLLALSLPVVDIPQAPLKMQLLSFLVTEHTLQHWAEQRTDVLRAALEEVTVGERLPWTGLRTACLYWAFVDRYFFLVAPVCSLSRMTEPVVGRRRPRCLAR